MSSSQLRDSDLVKWLDNKLGDNNELWSGRQAASLLSREMLTELETCFQALEPHVKLKIILAIPHLSFRLITLVRFFFFFGGVYLEICCKANMNMTVMFIFDFVNCVPLR